MNESNIHNEALTDKYVELMDWSLSPEQKVNMCKVLIKLLERGGKVAKFNTNVTAFGHTGKYRLFVPAGMPLSEAEGVVEQVVWDTELQYNSITWRKMGRKLQMSLFGVS